MPKIAGSFPNAAPGNAANAEGRKALYAEAEDAAAELNTQPKDGKGENRKEPSGDRQPEEVTRAQFFAGRRRDKKALLAYASPGTAGPATGPTS